MTDRMEEAAYRYFDKIEQLGGMVEAVKRNFPQSEIADASWRYQKEVDDGPARRGRRQSLRARRRRADRDPHIDPALERKQIEPVAGRRGPARLVRGREHASRG